jgi:hypothetical protein
MSAVLVFLLAVVAGRSTLLRLGPEVAVIPASVGCRVILGWGSVARAAGPGAGAGIPGTAAKVGQLGAECCHLVREVLDLLQEYVPF